MHAKGDAQEMRKASSAVKAVGRLVALALSLVAKQGRKIRAVLICGAEAVIADFLSRIIQLPRKVAR